MKIARILTRLNLGGPARQVLASDPRLERLGFQITVFAGEPESGEGDLRGKLIERGVRVVPVPGLQRSIDWHRDRRALRFLREHLKQLGPDLIHTHASKAGLLGRMAARSLEIPCVHTYHGHVLKGHYSKLRSKALARLERRMGKRTQALIAVSEATAGELAELRVAPRDRFHVVYGASDLEPLTGARRAGARLRTSLGLGSETTLIGCLGRLAPIKNPAGALAAFRQALPSLSDTHLVLIGDGVLRPKLEKELETWPIEQRGRVHLAGAWENMEHVLPDLDLLLSASHHEGLPIAFVEGGAVGLPAVATPVGGVTEFVKHGDTGWIGETTADLAEGLVALVGDPGRRRSLGSAAKELAMSRHSGDALAGRLADLYRELGEEHR